MNVHDRSGQSREDVKRPQALENGKQPGLHDPVSSNEYGRPRATFDYAHTNG